MEELRLILETVVQIGGYAYLLFIIYLAKGLLMNLLWAGVLILIVRSCFRLIQTATEHLRFGRTLGFTNPLTVGERKRANEVFDLGMEKWDSVYDCKAEEYCSLPLRKEDS